MAGEVLLINPRRRRRRKTRRAAASRPKRRRRVARRNPFAMNPRRRARRRVARRASRRGSRRTRRNPRMPSLGSIRGPLKALIPGLTTAAGVVATRWGATWLMSYLPAEWKADPKTLPFVRIGAKLAIGVVAPQLLGGFIGRSNAKHLAVGGMIAVGLDVFETWVESMLPLPAGVTSLADYEQRFVSAYEVEQLSGMGNSNAYGNSAYGPGAYGGF